MPLPVTFASRSRTPIVMGLFLLGAALPLAAVCAKTRATPSPPDVAAQLPALAQQQPWTCRTPAPLSSPGKQWQGGDDACAWQERLRMRRWSGPAGAAPNACVSAPAHWWAWARGTGSSNAQYPAAWQRAWTSQSLVDNDGAEKRIAIIERMPDGQWSAAEWRWNPSPRAATRRWQEERWALLAARAGQFRQMPVAPQGSAESRMLRHVLMANVGARPAEINGAILRYQANGLCLEVDAASPGEQQLQLPYSADDSRLEQRAAMQLQLARRFPKAAWLTPFGMVPSAPNVRSGAKFYAVWSENATLNGQLWIPTKGKGPLVRVRITTALPPAAQADAPALARMRQVIERELMGLATRWAYYHE